MSAVAKIPVRMTVEEFFAWTPPTTQAWQLVDGEPQAMAPASRTHEPYKRSWALLFAITLRKAGAPAPSLQHRV
jgi:Uma2 family endonuclease